MPGAFGQRRDGLDVLAREDFGRRHQRGLLADLGDRSGGEQRHDRLAGADVALQQPQHPHRLAQILGDGGDCLALRRRQRVRQGVDDLVAQMAVAGIAVAGRTPELRAHQRQRQLAGQQFVEGEPRPERAIGQNVGEFDRHMHAVERFADRRKAAAADDFRADPLGQIRQFLQRLRDRAAQRTERQTFRERIDRVDAAEFRKSGLVHDAVGMHDLRNAVVHLQRARYVALLADRQQLFDITGFGAEERQHHVAGIIRGIDEVRRAGIARRGRAVAIHGDFQRHHGSLYGFANLRLRPAVDYAGRQMQQQIDQSRRLVTAQQIAQQLVLLRPDARKGRDRRKQRIEQGGAHQETQIRFSRRARACPGRPRLFVLVFRSRRGRPGQARQDEHLPK